MTCYMRSMHSLFDTLGLEYDKPTRVRVDVAIRQIVKTPEGAHCPEVWAAIKALPPEEYAELPARVASLLG